MKKVKLSRTLVALAFGLLAITTTAQQRALLQGAQAKSLIPNSALVIVDESLNIRSIQFAEQTPVRVDQLKATLGLQANEDLRLVSSDRDNLGFEHQKFAQTINGYEVVGAQFILHKRDNMLRSANGLIFKNKDVNTKATLSESSALQIALDRVGGTDYMWNNPAEEQVLKRDMADENATYFPKGILKISSPNYDVTLDLRLVYQFDIYSRAPLGRYVVEVDAINGSIVNMYNRIHTEGVNGTGNSVYDGDVELQMDFDGTTYRLTESTRGNGVNTYDLQHGTNYNSAVIFGEADDYIDEPNNRAGVSAHYGAGATYDFFMNSFGRDSYDGNGHAINSYVHYSNQYFNAFWDGSRMTYGDGQNGVATELTTIDICGHEITHAVTEYTAGLIYSYESGALNESFSDVFGQTIEFIATPATASWNLADQIFLDGVSMIRSMSDPNSQGDPDTYQGDLWYTGSGDNGGVHYNSGVQNFWYYLLVEGGSGVNDHGYSYNVTGIGLEDAAQVAYRNLSVYLTPSSQYIDARGGAEQAAIDLFGEGSQQHLSVVEAWNAVGVPTIEPVLNVASTFDFGGVPVGLSTTMNLAVSNTGNSVLVVDNISITGDGFTTSVTSLNVNATSTVNLPIEFTPSSVTEFLGTISLSSNGGDAIVDLTGGGLVPPAITVEPVSIEAELVVGGSGFYPLTIGNIEGGSDLSWSISLDSETDPAPVTSPSFIGGEFTSKSLTATGGDTYTMESGFDEIAAATSSVADLGSVLESLNENHASITSLIPRMYEFTDGEVGTNISDGGDDMYDGGNFISTDLGGPIEYTNGVISSSDAFGGGEYFTAKYPGLFVLAADASNISQFIIDGNLGADGSGTVDGTVIKMTKNGKKYLGLIKRVGGTSDPSVNHLIILEQRRGRQTFSTNTDSDFHMINRVEAGTVYYLLFAGARGTYLDDRRMKIIMDSFLESSYSWISLSSGSGVIAPGQSTALDVALDASGLVAGSYSATITVSSNDPAALFIDIPVSLSVVSPTAQEIAAPLAAVQTSEISVYPNPTSDELIIQGVEVKSISLVDISGREILVQNRLVDGAMHLNLGSQAPGIYQLSITTKDGSILSRKIILSR
jgi:Zn-dependent metalloprotease